MRRPAEVGALSAVVGDLAVPRLNLALAKARADVAINFQHREAEDVSSNRSAGVVHTRDLGLCELHVLVTMPGLCSLVEARM